jgi:Phage tail assembly chaperone protein, TAC
LPTEKTLNGVTYRIGQLPARTQWNLCRRVAPLLEGLVPAVQAALGARDRPAVAEPGVDPAGASGAPTGRGVDLVALGMACVGPLTRALANLSDADSDYVINTCLTAVTRPNGNGSAYVPMATRAGQPLFATDDDLAVLLPLVGAVLWENLGGFLAVIGPTFGGPPAT